jgi:hypothetical protein
MSQNKEVWLLSGRLEGWDDDHATLVTADNGDLARRFFVSQTLLADNGYEAGERETCVNQCEIIGWLTPEGLMRPAHGVFE